MAWLIRAMCFVLLLSACALDSAADLRVQLDKWVWIKQVRYFQSEKRCTAAAYTLTLPEVSTRIPRAASVPEVLRFARLGKAMLIDMPGHTPDTASQQVMSADLPIGLGLLSVATLARPCMSDALARDVQRLLLSPDARILYDAGHGAVMLVDGRRRIAVYMRGKT